MHTTNYYLFKDNIDYNEAIKIYKDTIINDKRFIDEINESLLSIDEYYMPYYFIEAEIFNHPYYFRNYDTSSDFDGSIDINSRVIDKDFILNELSIEDSDIIEDTEFKLYDNKKLLNQTNKMVLSLKQKATMVISKRHCINPSKNIYIDVSPFKNYDNYKLDCYYEKIYVFRYINNKKDYISILSSYNKNFYKLDFEKSEEYLAYLKLYKRPIQYIPKEYLEYYYVDSFLVYLDVKNKLLFETSSGLLSKIKKNIDFEKYSAYSDYLYSGIFYYRISKYLKKIIIKEKPLKYKIYQSFLTLKYNKDSGLFLYNCSVMGLLEKRDDINKIKYLECSYKLGSLDAKKELYDYYNSPLNYNYSKLNRYS